jgi:hypothetical protein
MIRIYLSITLLHSAFRMPTTINVAARTADLPTLQGVGEQFLHDLWLLDGREVVGVVDQLDARRGDYPRTAMQIRQFLDAPV